MQDKEGSNGRFSSISMGSAATPPSDLPDYLAREVLKLTVRSAVELEAVWAQVWPLVVWRRWLLQISIQQVKTLLDARP